MAIRNPNLDEEIIGYDTLQTARLNEIADYVVEIGSNEYGSWEKWASGKLVCTVNCTWGNSVATAHGSVFRYGVWVIGTNNSDWIYPHAFVNNRVHISGAATATLPADIIPESVTSTTATGFNAYRYVNTFQWTSYTGIIIATGQWK